MVFDEKKESCYSKGYESLGFAGALLMDLILQGKITLAENSIEIVDSNSTGDELLDKLLEEMKISENKRSLMKWIDKISQKYTYSHSFFDLMEHQGILKSEINPDLKIKHYYLQNSKNKSQLLEEIHNVVNNKKPPSINIICLLALLEESKLIKIYMPRDLRKKTRNTINEFLYSEQLDSFKKEMILRIKKEIVNVVGARNMFMID